MKNLSFPKLLGIFGGFLLIILVIAAIAVSAGRHGGAQPLTTKVYHHDPATAAPTPEAVPPAVAPIGPPSRPTSPMVAAARTEVADELTPATASIAPPSVPAASCAPEADVTPRLSTLDGRLDALTVRVGALEAAETAALQRSRTTRAAPLRNAPSARSVRPKALTTLDGYKTMAIVSDRAWVRMPDGTEDSATTGDALPRPRVRSVTQDTGVVITSTDERIDPQ
jgi:hypothetical protein